MSKILLIGGTDYTVFVAEYLYKSNMLAGVINTSATIQTNSQEKQSNIRYWDLKYWCLDNNVYFRYFESAETVIQAQQETKAQLSLLAGVHRIIPSRAIQSFPLDMYAIHASRLPELKGWSPLNWAILLGLKSTAVSLFKVSSGIDDGPILCQAPIELSEDIYIGDLLSLLNEKTKVLLETLFESIKTKKFHLIPQNGDHSSFVLKRREEDSQLNWDYHISDIYKIIRASSRPYSGAFSYFQEKKVIIYRASLGKIPVFGRSGQIFKIEKHGPLCISCKGGFLILEDIEIEGENDSFAYLSRFINESLGA